MPAGQLWSGVPAVFVRELSAAERALAPARAEEQARLALVHAAECAKTWQVVEEEEDAAEQRTDRSEYYYQRMTKEVCMYVCMYVMYVCMSCIYAYYINPYVFFIIECN